MENQCRKRNLQALVKFYSAKKLPPEKLYYITL